MICKNRCFRLSRLALVFSFLLSAFGIQTLHAQVSDKNAASAKASIQKAIDFLKKSQQPDGSWSPKYGPAVTGLVLDALARSKQLPANDPVIQKALAYVLGKVNKDGSIHDGILLNYNTSICLSALSEFNDDPKVDKVIKNALAYVKSLQYTGGTDEHGNVIDTEHAFFGGFGYGKHGRPDGSNANIAIQAFYDNNIECDKDPAMKNVLVFMGRLQGIESNKMFGDQIQPNGGAIYATSENRNKVGVAETKAGVDEKGHLRTYGSMTYAMFKSYVYARLDRNDPRVKAALSWISKNYTFEKNPGMIDDPKTESNEAHQGLYYYYLTAARALDAFGESGIKTPDGEVKNWRNDLTEKLVSLQSKDGSWTNPSDRWNEGDPNMVTGFAVLGLLSAAK